MIWAEKCFSELQLGYKKTFVYRVNGEIIANLVFQRHKEEPDVLELKNIRVEPEYSRRVASCRQRAVEYHVNSVCL